MTAAIVLDGREHRGDLAILIWPTVTAYTRFPKRVGHCFTALTAVLMVAVQVTFDPRALVHAPVAAGMILTALMGVGLFTAAIRESDIRHRREAVLDDLTGLLNRNAFGTRIAELRAQSRLADGGIGLILADLDHFKAVNDQYGHTKGDEVLRMVAERMAGCLRAYDSLYRIGGEELAVLVPGASADELATLSEQLRSAVRAQDVGGVPITISLGAARSRPGAELAWEQLYQAADRALYRAKAAGRDRAEIGGLI
jgi:diguanylate cyclase (GGDEF)-like protein